MQRKKKCKDHFVIWKHKEKLYFICGFDSPVNTDVENTNMKELKKIDIGKQHLGFLYVLTVPTLQFSGNEHSKI